MQNLFIGTIMAVVVVYLTYHTYRLFIPPTCNIDACYSQDVIVSLTTIPSRIALCHPVIESFFDQMI